MNFKDMLESDLKDIFHNSEEFAEAKRFRYNGNEYFVPVIMDHEGAKDRKRPSADNADGIFLVDVVMYVAFSDLKVIPRKGQRIEMGDDEFKIVTVENEDGEIILGLEMLDE